MHRPTTSASASVRPRREREGSAEFWREKLKGFAAPTQLPIDQTALLNEDGFGQRLTQLSGDDTERLRSLAARAGTSVDTLLMSAWALLLSRYGNESDVVFGVTQTARQSIAESDSMAVVLSTVPLRVQVDPDVSVIEWLQRVRAEWTALHEAEHVPLAAIRSVSEVPPASPLFETMVVYERPRLEAQRDSGGGDAPAIDARLFEQAGYPLNLLGYGDDGLVIAIKFDARRFEPATVDRMLGHLTTILNEWATDAQRAVSATPMLTAAERALMLNAWNDTRSEYPYGTSLAELIEAQVARSPNAPAVTFESETISYAELNARANRLARELQRCGAAPDTLVGLCVERSTDMIIGLLAIIKTGAGYVPLDPMFPRDRIAYMLEDSALTALITQRSLRPSLPAFTGAVVELEDAARWQDADAANLGVRVGADSIGVVIYTSGSTGKPKGVEISRRALINLLWSMREWLALTPSDRLLAVTTISFDIAGADVWLPLLIGAHTVVASREAAADGERLRALIERHDITFLQATPVTWRQLLAAGWTGKSNLQAVCTGEAMPPEVATGTLPLVSRLWNLYGPTETTIWSTGVQVTDAGGRISIGRPIANTQCYILDAYGQPVPIGVTGELYIAGDGLARGYLKRPELTAEKFVDNPFGDAPGARMYRTGDLARFLPDGTIECLGRADHQVKIRGFRIELGEIEAVLRSHPHVRQAVVIAREDEPGDKRLVGYIVADGAPDLAALRPHLRRTLPDYMVPSAIVALEQIPLTANGKIDRRALPMPAPGAARPEEKVTAARTHVEKQLTEIWEESFGISPIGVDQSFFDLGGHSILAVTMMGQIKRVFGKQLPLNALFESPTIAQLAKHIEEDSRSLGRHSLASIQASGSRPPIFWVPGGAALGLFRLRHIVTGLGPDQPVYGLGSSHPDSIPEIETVEQRATQYLELVRRVQPHGPYCFAGFCAGGLVVYEMAQRLAEANEPVAFVGMINSPYPGFPLTRAEGWLMRAQRLVYRARVSGLAGREVVSYLRKRIADRRAARADQLRLQQVASQVRESGFERDSVEHNQVLLDATMAVFERYAPRPYAGDVSLLISDDEAYAGLSRRLDSRYHWKRLAPKARIHVFPGGHEDVLGPLESGSFGEVLRDALGETLQRRS